MTQPCEAIDFESGGGRLRVYATTLHPAKCLRAEPCCCHLFAEENDAYCVRAVWPEEDTMPGIMIAVLCVVAVAALVMWQDRRRRDRRGDGEAMDRAARRAQGDADRYLPPPGGAGF